MSSWSESYGEMGAVEAILVAAILGGLGYLGWVLFAQLRGEHRRLDAVERGHQLAEDRTLAALEKRGALPTQPIAVESAAAIEPRAESEPCPICGGRLHVAEHVAEHEGARRQRRVTLRCGDCGRATTLWFELRAASPN